MHARSRARDAQPAWLMRKPRRSRAEKSKMAQAARPALADARRHIRRHQVRRPLVCLRFSAYARALCALVSGVQHAEWRHARRHRAESAKHEADTPLQLRGTRYSCTSNKIVTLRSEHATTTFDSWQPSCSDASGRRGFTAVGGAQQGDPPATRKPLK